jgi:hypothetical protein
MQENGGLRGAPWRRPDTGARRRFYNRRYVVGFGTAMERMKDRLTVERCLPADRERALLVGRVWLPAVAGPALVQVAGDDVRDLSRVAPTATALFEQDDPVRAIRAAGALPRLAALSDVLVNSDPAGRDVSAAWFLAPCDLAAIKAAGVTFVASMLERVIEEQARGDPAKAEDVRSISRSASARTPRSSPSRSRCRRSASAPTSASIRNRNGTIRSPRLCWP